MFDGRVIDLFSKGLMKVTVAYSPSKNGGKIVFICSSHVATTKKLNLEIYQEF